MPHSQRINVLVQEARIVHGVDIENGVWLPWSRSESYRKFALATAIVTIAVQIILIVYLAHRIDQWSKYKFIQTYESLRGKSDDPDASLAKKMFQNLFDIFTLLEFACFLIIPSAAIYRWICLGFVKYLPSVGNLIEVGFLFLQYDFLQNPDPVYEIGDKSSDICGLLCSVCIVCIYFT